MNSMVNSEDYKKLPITSLITGLLSLIVFSTPLFELWSPSHLTDIMRAIFVLSIGIILPIVAIICGSIDLNRIRKGLHRSKLFKGFDITGIILGSIVFLIAASFNLGEIIVPH